ncbi:MAG: hypothetical protein HMLKMBBP_01416 [Planctomycetes bacterium]|nr:hypothetical protein [Planctomycetota bacterium]
MTSSPRPTFPTDDEFRSAFAIRDAAATRVHAEMMFEMAADAMGATAWVQTWTSPEGEVQARTLYRCEAADAAHDGGEAEGISGMGGRGSGWFAPWPIATVVRGGPDGPSPALTSVPGVYVEIPPRPGVAPRLRGLGPGRLELRDGRQEVAVRYGGDGRWFETSSSSPPREALAGVIPALAARSAAPMELLAGFVASVDTTRHGPGRLLMPVRLPGGPLGAWNCALLAFRMALFGVAIPPEARWVAADGWTGRAVGLGATRDEAVAAVRREVERLLRHPPPPPSPDTSESSDLDTPDGPPGITAETSFEDGILAMRMAIRMQPQGPRIPQTSANTPIAAIPLPPLPDWPSPFGPHTRLVGDFGAVHGAFVRRDRDTITIVGEHALASAPTALPAELDAALDAADRRWDEANPRRFVRPPGFPEPPPVDCSMRVYEIGRGSDPAAPPAPHRSSPPGASISAAVLVESRILGFDAPVFDVRGLNGDHVSRQVVRVRRLRGG